MKIYNVRLGHANNSSSTHSVLFLQPGELAPEDAEIDEGSDYVSFGWEDFTAASPRVKRLYGAATLHGALKRAVGEHIAKLVIRDLCGLQDPPDEMTVDHDSHLGVPRPHRGVSRDVIDLDYARDLIAFLSRKDVVILGGNDNHDENYLGHPLAPKAVPFERLRWPVEPDGQLISRKDDDVWALFNQKTGAKVRFSFNDLRSAPEYKSSSVPELVDLKITDACPFACEFCYQDSTTSGGVAKYSDLSNILYQLASWGVFEVAIGGGEPTLYPEFLRVLRAARDYDIVPNFTTKSLAWLRGPDAKEILETIGSFAFSTQEANDVISLNATLEAACVMHHIDRYRIRASVQCIPELMTPWGLTNLLEAANEHDFKVTLLGYKMNGRGAQAKRNVLGKGWVRALVEAQGRLGLALRDGLVSIDTAIAQDAELMAELKASPLTYHVHEGAFSCYIDGVTQTWGPSSYCAPEQMVPWNQPGVVRADVYQSWAPK